MNLTFIVNSPTSSLERIVHSKLKSSASEIIGSQAPVISKSYIHNSSMKGRIEMKITKVTYSLHELSHPAFRHHWVISPINLPNLPEFVLRRYTTQHRQIPSQRHSMVIPQRQLFTTLILQIKNQFGVFTIFIGQHVLAFKDGSIEARASVSCEAIFDSALDVFSTEHLCRTIVPCTLQYTTHQPFISE